MSSVKTVQAGAGTSPGGLTPVSGTGKGGQGSPFLFLTWHRPPCGALLTDHACRYPFVHCCVLTEAGGESRAAGTRGVTPASRAGAPSLVKRQLSEEKGAAVTLGTAAGLRMRPEMSCPHLGRHRALRHRQCPTGCPLGGHMSPSGVHPRL